MGSRHGNESRDFRPVACGAVWPALRRADAIQTEVSIKVEGYAAHGVSVSAAVQPLLDCFDVPLFDDGTTEWAMGLHAAGEPFCLIEPASLRALQLPLCMRGAEVSASDRNGSSASTMFDGECVRPLEPIDLEAAADQAGLSLSWTRRSRSGFAWVDEIDAPLGETSESYRVTATSGSAALEFTTAASELAIGATDLQGLGSGTARIEVRQLGDWASSRPAQVTINLP
jgi:hypothetical protein